MCHDEIGVCAQNIDTIIHQFNSQHHKVGRAYVII